MTTRNQGRPVGLLLAVHALRVHVQKGALQDLSLRMAQVEPGNLLLPAFDEPGMVEQGG